MIIILFPLLSAPPKYTKSTGIFLIVFIIESCHLFFILHIFLFLNSIYLKSSLWKDTEESLSIDAHLKGEKLQRKIHLKNYPQDLTFPCSLDEMASTH